MRVLQHDRPENTLHSANKASHVTKKAFGSPRIAFPERFGHPGGHPRLQLLRGRRPQYIPTRQLVQDHTRHASHAAHAQMPKSKTILQPAVGRLDPRARRVPLLEHVGRLFHATTLQPSLLVSEFHRELTITCLFNRTSLPERARRARRCRHLDPRRCRLRVARTGCRPVARGAGVDHAGPLVPREVVDRQRLGGGLRRAAGNRTDQVHAPSLGGPDVFVAGVERVGQEFLGKSPGVRQLVEHRRDRHRVGAQAVSGSAAVIS